MSPVAVKSVATRPAARVRALGGLAERRPKAVLVGLVAVVVVLAVLSTVLFLLDARQSALTADEADARQAADRSVAELLTYDHTTIAQDVDRYAGLVTGPFGDDYVNLLRTVVVPAAEQNRVSTRTEVAESSVIGTEGDTVNILMFVNQASQAGSAPAGTPSGSRVKVSMEDVDGSWKISGFTPL